MDSLNKKQQRSILHFLISIANADSNIDPDEIKILKKIYAFLDFDPETHALRPLRSFQSFAIALTSDHCGAAALS